MLRGIHVGRATVSMMLAISIAIAAAAIWPNQSLAAEVESSSEGFGSSFQVEDADIDSGVYDGVDWRITTNNELLIGNAGDVQEFEYKQDRDAEDYPWNPYREQITSVRFMGTVRGNGSARTMFARCESLTNLDLSSFDTSGITDMSGMFANCTNITALDLSPLNTANATNMSGLLSWCTHLTTLDLSSFDTNNVTDMSSMFYHCENLASLDLSSFDTSNVVNLRFCFADCHNLDTLDLSNFDTANVHDMFAMFTRCRSLTALDLSSFDDSNVYNMESCFQDCSTLTAIDLSSFKTENVTDMSSMFNGCYALEEADLSTFDTGKVEDMRAMFKNCYELRTIFASSDWQPYYDAQMFVSCDSLIGGNGTKYNSEHTDSEYARIDGKEGLPGYFTEKGAPGKPSRLTDVEVKFKATIPDAEVDTKVDWDDAWFDQSSYTYNHELATTASVLATAAYMGKDSVEYDLRNLGFETGEGDYVFYRPKKSEYEESTDRVGYTIASRETDGGQIILVDVRGTPGNVEWLSNANVADSTKAKQTYHEGFSTAAERVKDAYTKFVTEHIDSQGNEGIDLDKAKVLITGHSRGAAVANLLGAWFDEGKGDVPSHGSLSPDRVFCYTYASPTTTTRKDTADDVFANIFNIVNPEDAVTKVPLTWWSYGRFGTTFVLPSKSNTSPSRYEDLLDAMNSLFRIYSAKEDRCIDYRPYANGALDSAYMTVALSSIAHSTEQYYTGSSISLRIVAELLIRKAMLGEDIKREIFGWHISTSEAISATADVLKSVRDYKWALGPAFAVVSSNGDVVSLKDAVESRDALAIKDVLLDGAMAVGDEFAHAHTQETYVSWMQSADADPGAYPAIFRDKYNGFRIACPVDVHVYDSDGNLVCSIDDDEVDESLLEDGLAALVVDGVKYVDVPADSKYRVEVTAREDGDMDFQVEELSGDGSPSSDAKAYVDVPLAKGQTFECEAQADSQVSGLSLQTDGGEAPATAILSGDEAETVTTSVTADGPGEAWGSASTVKGSAVTVHAQASEGSKFLGWHQDGKLVSNEPDYAFRPESDVELVAKFSEPAADDQPVPSDGADGQDDAKTSIDGAKVVLSKASFTYTGKAQKPSVKTISGKALKAGTDYTVKYSNASSKDVGMYKVTVTGKGSYTGTATATYKIAKAPNSAKAKKTKVAKTLKASKLKKKAQAVALPKVTTKFGKAKWKVAKKDKKKVLTLKNGKVQVKKKAKKGTYTIKLKASVPATKNYKAATTKVVTVKVTIK